MVESRRTLHHGQRDGLVLHSDVAEQIRALTADTSCALDREVPTGDYLRANSAKMQLGRLWDSTIAEMSGLRPSDPPSRLTALTSLLTRVRELESQVDDARVTESVEIMRCIRRALRELDDAATIDDLLANAAAQACTLGFDRALVSTVDCGTWNLHTMYIENDPALAAEMVAVGHEKPPLLDGSIIESDVVDRGRADLVYDVQANPRVNRDLVAISGCTSYGVAPLRSQGSVVGLVHADNYYEQRPVDGTDRAVLTLYAEGLSQTLARVSVVQGLASLNEGLRHLRTHLPSTTPPDHRNLAARHSALGPRDKAIGPRD